MRIENRAQKDALDDIARKIMRFRAQHTAVKEDRERITANTVFRALIDNFIDRFPYIKMEPIQNEDELREWLQRLFR